MLKSLNNGKAPGSDGIRKEDLAIDVRMVAKILALLHVFQYFVDNRKIPKISQM